MSSMRITHTHVATFAAILIASAASLSAHVVRGLISPTAATAFVSSPTPGDDRDYDPLPALHNPHPPVRRDGSGESKLPPVRQAAGRDDPVAAVQAEARAGT